MVKKGNKLYFVLPIAAILVLSLVLPFVAAAPENTLATGLHTSGPLEEVKQCFVPLTTPAPAEPKPFNILGALKDPLGYLSGKDIGENSQFGFFFGWMFIIVIVIFAYEAFAFIKIPKSALLRGVLSVVIAFLAALVVSKTEIYAALLSYGAAGLALFLALPLLVLTAFSVMVAYKADPFGLLLQKIVWIIYGSYLLLKSGILLLLKSSILTELSTSTFWAPLTSATPGWGCKIINFFGVQGWVAANYDTTILIIHVITAIAVFMIFVIMNDKTEAYIQDYFRNQEIKGLKDELERQTAKRRSESESTKVMGKQ